MKLNISISGPTGAGKTTFCDIICKRNRWGLISERIPTELFDNFNKNPYKHCFSLQKTIMQSRVESYLKSYKKINIFDRTISEDFEVFIAMHNQLGFLSNHQKDQLFTLSESAKKIIGEISLIVYINSNFSCLKKRIEGKFTPTLIVQNLQLQVELYKNWKNNIQTELIEINNSKLSLRKFKNIANSFNDALELSEFKNLNYREAISLLVENCVYNVP
jgi:deoxyadenosine/deoxycytidine kinase